MKKINKKVLVSILIIVLCVSYITPLIVYGAEDNSLGLFQTNEALGSPLLDSSNFKVSDWDKWELIAFGVFLSNFVNPFIDDYESAFSTGSEYGSKGAGLKALQFGSGNDSETNKVLQSLLKYAIKQQKDINTLKPLYSKYKVTYLNNVYDTGDEQREARVKELFLWTTSDGLNWANIGINAALGGSETGLWYKPVVALFNRVMAGESFILDWGTLDTGVIDVDPVVNFEAGAVRNNSLRLTGVQCAILPEFFILDNNNQPKIMLDYENGWDIQMMTAWLAKTFGGSYSNIITEDYFKDFLECKLYTDAFGNIVALKDGRPYMMFPAAANQYITSTPQFNMLQSVLFGGEYLIGDDATLIEQAISEGTNTGVSGISSGELPIGKAAILYDSDSFLYNAAMNDPQKTLNNSEHYFNIKKNTNINYGKLIVDLLDSEINKMQQSGVGFRIEIVKADQISKFTRVKSMGRACNVLSLLNTIDNNVPMLDYVMERSGNTHKLFGDAVILSTEGVNPAMKKYPNYLYNITKNNQTTAGSAMNWDTLKQNMKQAKTAEELANVAVTGNSNTTGIMSIFKSFVLGEVGYTVKRKNSYEDITDAPITALKDRGYTLIKGGNGDDIANIDYTFTRLIKLYKNSSVMQQVSNILAVREGTEFALWSPWIYITYLDWYGIIGDQTHKFDTKLYSENTNLFNFDIEAATEGMLVSDEEKKKDILNYTYMMLHPTAGKEYRANMIMDGFTNWVYKTYQNIVYGGSVNYYQTDTLSNRYGNGFLKINSYSDNFMTGWFISKYAEYVVILIAIFSILIIILGIIKQKKVIWYFVTFMLMINIIVLTPAIGELVPYVANNMVQNMFDDKMSYWAVSEGITNATIEKKVNNEYKYAQNSLGVTGTKIQEAEDVLHLVKTLNIAYLDRALMMKLDISKKITETQLGSYEEIQSLQSARWLLPIMLRQFTASDSSSNYVYVPLADQFDNLSNMYWKYKPSDKINTETINAGIGSNNQNNSSTDVTLSVAEKQAMYSGYIDTTMNMINQKDYMIIQDKYKNMLNTSSWQSLSRNDRSNDKCIHTFFYLLRFTSGNALPANTTGTNWNQYVEINAANMRDDLVSAEAQMEISAGAYNYRDPDSVKQEFGFLWNTENPLHYFYQVVKDTFDNGKQLSVLAGELQGSYIKNEYTKEEVRSNFMFYEDTGKIRDFLDMEELFTNVMPYMYSMQVLSGGMDGKSGVFGDEKIELYKVYKNNYKSWMYRSNWITKLMESNEYTKPVKVQTLYGREVTIENPMIPSSYPVDRPMIFSEAQMYALGLNESYLTQPELKILKINEAVERKWTLLLNYVNVPGITKEVLYRQMAIDALIQFNKEFTSSNVLNSSLALYPTGLDLRNISFDSVMKMLMLNNTKDTRYIYGDTMLRVIENNDMFSAILMLVGAFLCSYVIPFVRDVLLGLLFYLGYFAVLLNIISSNKTKLKITTAFIINNVVFLIMNLLYYLMFSLMINLTYKDNVLSISNITIDVGSPVWIFIIIDIVSIIFIWLSYKLIKLSIVNYRDMGFELYATWAGLLANKISDGVQNVGDAISDIGSKSSEGTSGASIGESRTQNNTVINNGNVIKSENYEEEIYNTDTDKDGEFNSGYLVGIVDEPVDRDITKEIDAEINKGKEM